MTSELDGILEAMTDWRTRRIRFALATVVGVRGSTYRGLAARQLISSDGTSIGTVSGGCLDAELTAAARDVVESGASRIVEFDLTADDEAVWGWGIGCNGVTVVLIEPDHTVTPLASGLDRLRSGIDTGVLMHAVDESGRRWFPWEDRPEAMERLAAHAFDDGRTTLARVPEMDLTVLLEVFGGPPRLLVCGAGHDAVPLVRLGAGLGFEVIVVDDRRQFLTHDRFPDATSLIAGEPSELARAVDLDRRTHAVLITHNYLRDLEYLRSMLGTSVAYIGALGPGERLERLVEDLRDSGDQPSPQDLAKLHGPAGLDIGAEGPIEIAWSILTEIQAARRGRDAGFLRDTKGPDLRPGSQAATG